MFNFIKKLFSGLISFFSGLFGGKKSDADTLTASKSNKKNNGYFMQLEEDQAANPAANVKTDSSKPVEEKKPEPAKTQSAQEKKPEPVKATTSEKPKTQQKPEKKPEPVAAVSSKNGKVETQSQETFAPQYLTPTASMSRRRPGPSMDTFRSMARQVKVPNA